MLFKPEFKDSEFINKLNVIYHDEFKTAWIVESVCHAAKGFHIKLKNVDDCNSARYFLGENFSLPEEQLKGKTNDVLVGETVYSHKLETYGKVISISKTAVYYLIEIEKENGERKMFPLTDEFFLEQKEMIILKREV